jgi:hypothetical protein
MGSAAGRRVGLKTMIFKLGGGVKLIFSKINSFFFE